MAKVQRRPGERFPGVGFVDTNLGRSSRRVVRFDNQRGRAEQSIKEGKYALHRARPSCHEFVDNPVRLQLFALAYTPVNFLRRLALPMSVKHRSLSRLREKLIKIGAKIMGRTRYVPFRMAEAAIPRDSFRRILATIRRLVEAATIASG